MSTRYVCSESQPGSVVGVYRAARVLCWFVVLLANSFERILFWAWYWHLCSTKIIMLQMLEPGSGIFYFLFWKWTKLSHFHESDYKSLILNYNELSLNSNVFMFTLIQQLVSTRSFDWTRSIKCWCISRGTVNIHCIPPLYMCFL